MAAPNLKNPTTITGITTVVNLNSTSITGILTNASGSNKVLKINTILAANVDGTSAADVSVSVLRGGVDYYLAKTVSVPADATQVLCSKDIYFYLEENVGIRAQASAADDIHITIGYEEIA